MTTRAKVELYKVIWKGDLPIVTQEEYADFGLYYRFTSNGRAPTTGIHVSAKDGSSLSISKEKAVEVERAWIASQMRRTQQAVTEMTEKIRALERLKV